MRFIGTENYTRLFHDRLFWKAIGNTLKFLSLHIPLATGRFLIPCPTTQPENPGCFFFQGFFFYAGYCFRCRGYHSWQQLYGYDTGMINRLLAGIGISKKGWLINPDLAIYSIAIMATWKNLGLYVILFLVGLQTVPEQYYEAAKMEGANSWQRFFHITLPMINPTIFMVVVLSTIGGFSLFIEPYIMTSGVR